MPSNTRYCKKYRLKHYYIANIVLISLNKQCKLSLMPSSTPNYSSNRHSQFSCMLGNSKYSSKLSMKSLSPGNTRYCIARKVKNCYKVNTRQILLNKQCKLWLKPDSTPNYKSSKHLSFSCMLSIMKYWNKLNKKLLKPSNTRYCKKYKFLRSDYTCCSLQCWSKINTSLS
jgi:hypothetical protein